MVDMAGDQRSHEIRRLSEEVLRSLFDMAAPQMPQVLSSLSTGKQDQAKAILEKHPPRTPGNWEGDTVDNISGWKLELRLSKVPIFSNQFLRNL